MPFTDGDRRRAHDIIARYPHRKSALLPLLHLAQDRDGWVTPEAMTEIGRLLDLAPAQVLGVCSFYTMFKREPPGRFVVSVCTNVACLLTGGPELHARLREAYAGDADVLVEEVECLAACDRAPVLQVNYEYHGPLAPDGGVALVDDYKAGRIPARTISGSPARRDAGSRETVARDAGAAG